MIEFFSEYWWFIFCVVSGIIFAIIKFMSFYETYTDQGKKFSVREIVGLFAIFLSALILGVSAITGIIDGKY